MINVFVIVAFVLLTFPDEMLGDIVVFLIVAFEVFSISPQSSKSIPSASNFKTQKS